MKKSQYHQCFYFIKFLQSLSPKIRRQVLGSLKKPLCSELYDSLSVILFNIENNKIKGVEKIKPVLKRKRIFKALISPKFNRRLTPTKKAAVIRQSGGFLSLILPVVATLVGEAVGKYVKF